MKRSWIASLTGAALAAVLATAAPAQPAHNGDDPVEPFAIGEGLYYVGASDTAADAGFRAELAKQQAGAGR